jgi:3-oxoadipate enol-lactonase
MILNYESYGSGREVVIVLHEWLGDHRNYQQIMAYLDGDTYQWLFVDLRGYGLSKDISGAYTCDESSLDLIALADNLQIESFHLVGHSMTGLIAMNTACEFPDRILSLTLLTPVPPSGIQVPEATRHDLEMITTDVSLMEQAIQARTANRYCAGWIRAKIELANSASEPDVKKSYLKMFLETNIRSKITRLKVRPNILIGQYDVPLYSQQAMQSAYGQLQTGYTLQICAEAGHYPMLECPGVTASFIENSINGLL